MTKPQGAAFTGETTQEVLEITWPPSLRGDQYTALRGAIAYLLHFPGGRIDGDDAILDVQEAAGLQCSTGMAIIWLREVESRIRYSLHGTPRVWLTKAAKNEVRVRRVQVPISEVATRLVGPQPPMQPVRAQRPRRIVGQVRSRSGTLTITWPPELCARRQTRDRRVLAHLFMRSGRVQGDAAFGALIEWAGLPPILITAMFALGQLEEAGWIVRRAFGVGAPLVELTALALDKIKVEQAE